MTPEEFEKVSAGEGPVRAVVEIGCGTMLGVAQLATDDGVTFNEAAAQLIEDGMRRRLRWRFLTFPRRTKRHFPRVSVLDAPTAPI